MFETVSKCRTTEGVRDFLPFCQKQSVKVYAASISNLCFLFKLMLFLYNEPLQKLTLKTQKQRQRIFRQIQSHVLQIEGCSIYLSVPVHME